MTPSDASKGHPGSNTETAQSGNHGEWIIADTGASDPAFNMALDEALMEFASELGQPVLRFYGWNQPAGSFGYFQRISEIEAVTPFRPLIRRPTGGGLVPHDRDWTYSVTIPPEHGWYGLRAGASYERMHRWIQNAFAALKISTELAAAARRELPGQCFAGYEPSDVLWFGRKIAGAAQRRSRSGLLIQGSIQPQPPGVTRAAWQSAMLSTLDAAHSITEAWPARILGRATQLVADKFSRDEYNRRR